MRVAHSTAMQNKGSISREGSKRMARFAHMAAGASKLMYWRSNISLKTPRPLDSDIFFKSVDW